jgi:DNA polymerase-4
VAETTEQTQTILVIARGLLAGARPVIESRGMTLLGVSLGNLEDEAATQLVLPLRDARPSSLDVALDEIRDRFGSAAVTRAVLVGRDQGLTVPLLPD